ncbi:dTDP-4-dehydrorhamnose 3,5-epimerase family protein [Aurantiacibacter rhizosphaerae]|uniref:dTDP-4-dehydrorhamnose 3,5-epimerase n=1 Tax=Aurantiacibacter rhizosphaerae TaxID=2691582 RepID=A0A844XAZ4_9SPHN|nr:dTDP-4-dehydrorhamnose 3,5-epimerase family protein [Aurantiacibacter rhizosphaerae]MWV26695.1 dTDP-4-dehydrorhamnose 3,5-epimerase [Aurantiacibacter rhizosphaerae]
MRFEETAIPGVFDIDSDIFTDERGSFQRAYCADEWRDHGLEPVEAQSGISRNRAPATLRGLHVIPEHEGPEHEGEAKLVRCIRGRIFDVAVDLRPGSATYLAHITRELDADRGNALYLPRGVAHGFMTLQSECDVLYQFSRPHRANVERGVRWDDPDIAVPWPMQPEVMSERDRNLPLVAQFDSI